MAVMPRDVLAQMCAPHLDRGEDVRECVEASVLEVNGRRDAAGDVGRVVVALTDRRLLTLVWRGGADPEPDGSVPLGFVDDVRVDDAPVGATLTIGLSTRACVRFAVGPAQRDEARALAAAAGSPRHTTEEIPVVGPVGPSLSRDEVEARMHLAAELAAVCERNRGRILELAPGVVVAGRGDAGATYFVHVVAPSRPQGACPRCEHVNRDGAVFCDACGALM